MSWEVRRGGKGLARSPSRAIIRFVVRSFGFCGDLYAKVTTVS